MQMTYARRNGHERYKFVHRNNNEAALSRKKRSLQRLDAQLISNTKSDGEGNLIPLEESDVKRIKKEIATLKIKLSIS